MSRKYHTVLIWDAETKRWCIHFGDYDIRVAREESRDMVDAGERTKLITTGDTQAEIEAAVRKLNGDE